MGRDPLIVSAVWASLPFQSTRPVWGETIEISIHGSTSTNFNPLAPCGARRREGKNIGDAKRISIHSPRVGRDHSSFGGSDLQIHFNPLAPCGARQEITLEQRVSDMISIHSPRVGRDPFSSSGSTVAGIFQSTRPVWGETEQWRQCWPGLRISIHSPRVGRDLCGIEIGRRLKISIHSPRVGRDEKTDATQAYASTFQSTRPVWGETGQCREMAEQLVRFQSTRPVWGETRATAASKAAAANFNPLAPCGARRCARRRRDSRAAISIHSPRVGRDGNTARSRIFTITFQSTRPVWGETRQLITVCKACHISIHSPRVGRDTDISERQAQRYIFQSTRPVWGETRRRAGPS